MVDVPGKLSVAVGVVETVVTVVVVTVPVAVAVGTVELVLEALAALLAEVLVRTGKLLVPEKENFNLKLENELYKKKKKEI